ncbi:DUF397 domain-containing protein [Nocardia sp. R6R-6]|uniref:DUF397 domain-containing protein n=1 Tax=Nocardia sp. R6R-6 TaxID=3459303 RepID=UPI00403DD7F1
MTTGDRLEWRKSSYSGNSEQCVEVAPSAGWRTSSHSSNGEGCVELVPSSTVVYVRHSKHPDAGTIAFDLAEWACFVDAAHAKAMGNVGSVVVAQDGTDTLVTSPDVQLRFNEAEWTAFLAGADDGEFAFRSAAAK